MGMRLLMLSRMRAIASSIPVAKRDSLQSAWKPRPETPRSAARIGDAKHDLGSRVPYQLLFVRDAEPWRQREPGNKTGSRPEHGHPVDPALPRLDMYLGTDRQRIRKQDLGALPDLPGLTLQSR